MVPDTCFEFPATDMVCPRTDTDFEALPDESNRVVTLIGDAIDRGHGKRRPIRSGQRGRGKIGARGGGQLAGAGLRKRDDDDGVGGDLRACSGLDAHDGPFACGFAVHIYRRRRQPRILDRLHGLVIAHA